MTSVYVNHPGFTCDSLLVNSVIVAVVAVTRFTQSVEAFPEPVIILWAVCALFLVEVSAGC